MSRLAIAAFLLLGVFPVAQAQVTTTHGKLKLIHARATQTAEPVRIVINSPREGEIVAGPDVSVEFTLQNWTPAPGGNHLHFLLDDQPYLMHESSRPVEFRNLAPGAHTIRAFPVYAWHESVKQQQALAVRRFYVKKKAGSFPLDPSRPMMIYNAPVGEHNSVDRIAGQPFAGILVDWFLHHVEMGSRSGYFVRISVDGVVLTSMKEWRPHYIQNLSTGKHTVKLELLKNGTPVPDNGNSIERQILVR